MEPYAYFPFNEESEAVTLFDYIDKKLQGEDIPTFETVADLDISNIYLSHGFRIRLISYFDSINDFFTEIEKYPLNNKNTHQIDLFLHGIRSLVSDSNYFKKRHYTASDKWKINKHILMNNKKSAFYCLLNELFFNIGLQTNISFDDFKRYINALVRLDYIYLYNSGKIENKESIQSKINREPELQSIIFLIKSHSCDEYLKNNAIIESFNNIASTKEDRKKLKKSYLHILSQEKNLINFMNERYYIFGRQEKHKRAKQLIVKQQHQENIRRFNASTGIAIDENPARPVCMNCGDKKQIIYDVNLYTPFQYTVSSVCIHCLPSVADGLKQTINNYYTFYPISSQFAVNCFHFDRPIKICTNCGNLTNTTFEFVAARKTDSVILCRDCVKEVIKKINKKHKMEMKTLHEKNTEEET